MARPMAVITTANSEALKRLLTILSFERGFLPSEIKLPFTEPFNISPARAKVPTAIRLEATNLSGLVGFPVNFWPTAASIF